jgi:hypothetical protein
MLSGRTNRRLHDVSCSTTVEYTLPFIQVFAKTPSRDGDGKRSRRAIHWAWNAGRSASDMQHTTRNDPGGCKPVKLEW